MRWSRLPLLLCCILASLHARCVLAEVAEEDVQSFSRKIAANLDQGETITLAVRTLFPQWADEVPMLRQLLRQTLSQQRIRIMGKPTENAAVLVTLSRNSQGGVLVGEIHRDGNRVVLIQPFRLMALAPPTISTKYSIQKELIWQQETPFLDLLRTENKLLILELDQIAVYTRDSNHWQLQQRLPFPSEMVLPRDARGRLNLQNQTMTVFLPGSTCQCILQPSASLTCDSREAEWPLIDCPTVTLKGIFSSGKNYFDGQVKPGSSGLKTLLPFYSAALLGPDGKETLLFTGLDGKAHVYNRELEPLGSFGGWGSEIAAVESECDHQRLILATQPGDRTKADAIQAFRVTSAQSIAVSEPFLISGPVMALWPASDRGSAFAIVKDLTTNRYAAFQLSASCQP